MTRRLARAKRWTVVAAFVPLILGVTAVRSGASTVDATVDAPATITNPDGRPRSSGGSETAFAVALPHGAACAHKSTGGFHVASYLVPEGTDVGTVRFSSVPSFGFGLIDAQTKRYYGHGNTKAGTRQVPRLPNFKWAPLVSTNNDPPTRNDLLYSGSNGVWDGGIACVDPKGNVTNSWKFRVMFLASRSDKHGFTWCTVPDLPSDAPEAPYAAALPLIGLAVAGGFVVFRRRRSRTEVP